MRRRIVTIALLGGLTLATAACGAEAPASEPASEVVFVVSGGIAGIEESTRILRDGTLIAPDGSSRAADPALVDAVFEIIDTDGTFAADHDFPADDPCCDRFSYSLTVVRPGGTVAITTMDEAAMPAAVGDALAAIWTAIG